MMDIFKKDGSDPSMKQNQSCRPFHSTRLTSLSKDSNPCKIFLLISKVLVYNTNFFWLNRHHNINLIDYMQEKTKIMLH